MQKIAWIITFITAMACSGNSISEEMHASSIIGSTEIVEMVITQKFDKNYVDESGASALIHAVMLNDREAVRKLIGMGVDVNLLNKNGFSALLIASQMERSHIVEDLIKAKADLEVVALSQNGEFTINPLHQSVAFNQPETLKILLKYGANPNPKLSLTPLHVAVLQNKWELAETLVEAGADPEAAMNIKPGGKYPDIINVSTGQIYGLSQLYPGDRRATDYLAEMIYSYHLEKNSYFVDSLSWAAKAIGDTEDGRYAQTMKEIIDSNAHRKLKKHARNALKRLKDLDQPQYGRGDFIKHIYSFRKVKFGKDFETSQCTLVNQGHCVSSGSFNSIGCELYHRLRADNLGANVAQITNMNTTQNQYTVNGQLVTQTKLHMSAAYYDCQNKNNPILSGQKEKTSESMSVKERLEVLGDLFKQGLLNQKEYEEKKRSILNDL